MVVVSSLMTLVLLGTAALIVRNGGGPSDDRVAEDEFTVERGSFEISLPTSGELAALDQIEISAEKVVKGLVPLLNQGTSS